MRMRDLTFEQELQNFFKSGDHPFIGMGWSPKLNKHRVYKRENPSIEDLDILSKFMKKYHIEYVIDESDIKSDCESESD